MSLSVYRFCSTSIVVLLLAATTLTAAQPTSAISGLVSDQTGASVTGAKVDLVGPLAATRSAVTDGQGRYRFEGLPAGDYTVRVTASGFQLMERRVSVTASGAAVADLRLVVSSFTENVVVTEAQVKAEIAAQRALTPGGVTVVDSSDLARRQINGMADMLRYVPGVWAESVSGSDELFFSSRGSNLDSTDYDKNGIKLLQDGLPVTTADGNNHNRTIDPLSARYSVVARGANALTYGASTLGGAMDFISPTARNSAPVSVLLNTGSYGSLNGRATFGAAGNKMDGLITVEGKQWEGYRDHSTQDRFGVYANAGWQPSKTVDIRFFGTYVNNDMLLPSALTRAEVEADPSQAGSAAINANRAKDVTTGRGAVKATWNLGANRSFTAGLSYEGQSLYHPIVERILIDFDGPGPNAPVEVFSLLIDTDHRDLGGMARYNHRVGGHDLLAGINYGKGSVEGGNYRNNNGEPNGLTSYVDNKADSVEAYLTDRWHVANRWTMVLGAQFVNGMRDVRTTDAASGAVDNPYLTYSSFNPRAGVIASVNPSVELYGNVSRLFEAPTTFQMENDVRGGDATLDPMTGIVSEVGLRSTTSQSSGTRWSWDLTAYYARINDEILSIDDPAAPGNSLVTNIDKTVHAGVEALGSVSFEVGDRHRIDPMVSLTINQFHFDGDAVYGGNDLPAAPTYAARGEVIYRHVGGAYAGPTFDFIGRRYADFANRYVVDGYGLMGLRAGFSGSRWEVFGDVRNLFDADYIATVSVLNVAGPNAAVLYPGSPRSAFVGLKFSY
jgi:iron complex outermembrane receptor protein